MIPISIINLNFKRRNIKVTLNFEGNFVLIISLLQSIPIINQYLSNYWYLRKEKIKHVLRKQKYPIFLLFE